MERPKRGEDEDELLQFQQEFLASKASPSPAPAGGKKQSLLARQIQEQGVRDFGVMLQEERVKMDTGNDARLEANSAPVSVQQTGQQARFDFRGNVVPADADVPVTTGLHHHGDEPERAGYTLEELFTLARSSNIQQRGLALNTLGYITQKEALDETSSWYQGLVTPSLLPARTAEMIEEKRMGEQNEDNSEQETDADMAKRDLILGLVDRMLLLQRLHYILDSTHPQAPTVVGILEILTRVAQHSMQLAYESVFANNLGASGNLQLSPREAENLQRESLKTWRILLSYACLNFLATYYSKFEGQPTVNMVECLQQVEQWCSDSLLPFLNSFGFNAILAKLRSVASTIVNHEDVTGDEYLAHDLMSTVLFNPDFIPEGKEEELTTASLADLKISDTHILKSATQEEITTTNCQLLRESVKSLAVIRAQSHYQQMPMDVDSLVTHRIGEYLMPHDWVFLPLVELYNQTASVESSAQNNLSAAVISMVTSVLQWIFMLESWRRSALSHVSVTLKISRVMCVFLAGNDLFLEKSIYPYLASLFRCYTTPQLLDKMDFEENIPGISSFYDL
nr:hypothetical protein BaRGS_031308 [Batillaria attramentaria]